MNTWDPTTIPSVLRYATLGEPAITTTRTWVIKDGPIVESDHIDGQFRVTAVVLETATPTEQEPAPYWAVHIKGRKLTAKGALSEKDRYTHNVYPPHRADFIADLLQRIPGALEGR